MRQDEPDFVKAIHDISRGELPTDTHNLLKRLPKATSLLAMTPSDSLQEILTEKSGQLGVAVGRVRKKKGLRLIDFHTKNVIKPEKSLFEFYELNSVQFLSDLECCNISYSLATEFNLEFEENVLSESELSEFTYEEIDEIEKMVHVNENVGDPIDSVASEDEIHNVQVNLNDCPISLDDIRSCLPDMLVTDEQVFINERLNLLLEKHKLQLNLFLTTIFENISDIYEQVFGSESTEKKTDSKSWTNYFSKLYKFSHSNEYISLIENCCNRKAESDDFTVFSRIFDFVSHFIIENKTSNIKDSTELPHQQSAYSNDDAGLGKLRYIAGRCIAKSKYHYMTIGKNNMYKKNKQSCVTDCFLKVKILDYMTTTYADLLESSSYKESLEETKRKQNLTQGLTDIKDDVLDFFVDIDRNRINYQNEKMFHKHGSNIFNFVHEKLLSSKTLFTNFQKLLQNFDLTATFVRVDEDLAMACLKDLYSDLILRFCRVSDNQFRKDLIKSFGMQKSETLRKRVVETAKRDNTIFQMWAHLQNLNEDMNNKSTSCEDLEQAQVVEDLEQAQVVENLEQAQVVENLEHVPVVEDRKQSAAKKEVREKENHTLLKEG
ncbi:Hypothetical predicted protein [Mytilus galloprovincialis]|uniref:Uncharacterized protein n=1 Tax=Mytilus galloprovincialis TaxID=29158 RepID=A0A8B6CEU6_MYTGA|nr:Hypothetical predicted protein [Mytilus galloprovincialis]